MKNKIEIFKNEEFGEVRVLTIDNEPWFVGKDVAKILGYAKARNAISTHVDEDDALKQGVIDELGRIQETTLINESGLYSLILSSKLPKAKAFKRWVTSEVLPSIRKYGAYMTEETIEKVLEDPDTIIKLATQLKEERARKELLEAEAEKNKPKVLFAEAVEAAKSSILVGELAKIMQQNGIQIGQNRLFEWLRSNGYLGKSGENRNLPTQYSMELNLFEIKKRTINNPDGSIRVTRTPKVTGKGQIYFINKFKAVS